MKKEFKKMISKKTEVHWGRFLTETNKKEKPVFKRTIYGTRKINLCYSEETLEVWGDETARWTYYDPRTNRTEERFFVDLRKEVEK